MMLAPVERRAGVVEALQKAAMTEGFDGAGEIPVAFVQTGGEVLFNSGGN
jgi:hypothetical protein